MKIAGDAIWGLANATPARGQTTTWIRPVQATELVGGVPANVYIDEWEMRPQIPRVIQDYQPGLPFSR